MTAPAPDITRGILLAGGRGTRLFPLTVTTSKQLVPIFNKPTIFYPLSTMIAAGVHDILIITTPEHQASFQQLLGDGRSWGVRLSYATQAEPRGIAEALLIGAEYIAGAAATLLMLGDNLLFGPLQFLRDGIRATIDSGTAATIFGYHVSNPQAYGVVDFDDNFNALSIEEKPAQPKSSWAVPGMYIFPRDVVARARRLQPSKRGELEITDLNRAYLDDGLLRVNPIGRGVAWLD
ncbi:MAG: sugar nucleotidyltransferase, partial [Planctomycetota bacterium]